jgi:predicted transcriptional regulator
MTPELPIDPELAHRVAEVARARGESLHAVVERVLRAYVENERDD